LINDDCGDDYSEYMMENIMSNPHESILDIELASTYLEKGNMDMAESIYINALSKNPNDIDLNRAFADLLATEGKYNDAIDSYTNYIADAPTDPYGFIQLADIYFKLGDNDQGWIFYDRGMALTNES
jgi:tetratricopeptide (TPR) repeat protein